MQLTLMMSVTLDGVVQSPGAVDEDQSNGFDLGGWVVPFAHDMEELGVESFAAADAYLLGRRTFDVFEAFWPQVTDDDHPFAKRFREQPKYVTSNTRTHSELPDTHFLSGDVVGKIEDLKAQPGNELQVHGSQQLVQLLVANDLVDEYRLVVFPVILGKGKRLFETVPVPKSFTLESSRAISGGIVSQVFRPGGEAKFGSFRVREGAETVEM